LIMYDWMKKIHMYAGLFSFMAFVIWGVTGILAVFLPPPGEWRPPAITMQREFPFVVAENMDDKEVAREIYAAAGLTMAGGYYNVHRNDAGNLAFIAFSTNGQRDITYLEKERRVRIDFRDGGLGDFLSNMHTGHSRRGPPDLSSRLWGYYNEFSTWAFLFMVLSGIYLWLATRPGMRWALILMSATATATLVLWSATR
jgi:hypothetical protein